MHHICIIFFLTDIIYYYNLTFAYLFFVLDQKQRYREHMCEYSIFVIIFVLKKVGRKYLEIDKP